MRHREEVFPADVVNVNCVIHFLQEMYIPLTPIPLTFLLTGKRQNFLIHGRYFTYISSVTFPWVTFPSVTFPLVTFPSVTFLSVTFLQLHYLQLHSFSHIPFGYISFSYISFSYIPSVTFLQLHSLQLHSFQLHFEGFQADWISLQRYIVKIYYSGRKAPTSFIV